MKVILLIIVLVLWAFTGHQINVLAGEDHMAGIILLGTIIIAGVLESVIRQM